jgi:hypothetical protein
MEIYLAYKKMFKRAMAYKRQNACGLCAFAKSKRQAGKRGPAGFVGNGVLKV